MHLLVEKKKRHPKHLHSANTDWFVKNLHQDHKDEMSVSWIILLSKTKCI